MHMFSAFSVRASPTLSLTPEVYGCSARLNFGKSNHPTVRPLWDLAVASIGSMKNGDLVCAMDWDGLLDQIWDMSEFVGIFWTTFQVELHWKSWNSWKLECSTRIDPIQCDVRGMPPMCWTFDKFCVDSWIFAFVKIQNSCIVFHLYIIVSCAFSNTFWESRYRMSFFVLVPIFSLFMTTSRLRALAKKVSFACSHGRSTCLQLCPIFWSTSWFLWWDSVSPNFPDSVQIFAHGSFTSQRSGY